MTEQVTCKTCCNHNHDTGNCHRYPPQIVWDFRFNSAVALYPWVHDDHWCSEYNHSNVILKVAKE